MARHIDESKPLSADDRQWLTDWGRQDVIDRIDAAHGKQEDQPDSDTVKVSDLKAILAKNGIDPGDGDVLAALDSALAGKPGSTDNSVRTIGDSAGHVAPEADSGEATPEDDYDDWNVDELKDELGDRELSKSGNKSDLIARLREHDATRAAGSEDDQS